MSRLRRLLDAVLGPDRTDPDGGTAAGPDVEGLGRTGRAAAGFAALERHFAVAGRRPGFLEEVPWRGGARCHLWPLSRVAAAALDLHELGVRDADATAAAVEGAIAPYRRDGVARPAFDSSVRPPLGGGGDRFYDDNAWVALDLLRLHRLTGRPTALTTAAEVFAFLVSGWDDDPGRAHPGGVRWVESPTNEDRNTVSTVPAAQVGYGLHDLTGDESALAWADRMLAWTIDALRDPADGLFWDHVGADGAIERTKWSYNQGSVVGASLAAHAAATRTGEARTGGAGNTAEAHLHRAEEVAAASLDRYLGRPGELERQGLPFGAIWWRNLLELRAVTAHRALAARIEEGVVAHAERVWATRSPDGLFRPAGRRPVALIDQAAAVEILALAALTEPRPGPHPEPGPGARPGPSPESHPGPGPDPTSAGGPGPAGTG